MENTNETVSTPAPKKRGRKPGSKNSVTKKTTAKKKTSTKTSNSSKVIKEEVLLSKDDVNSIDDLVNIAKDDNTSHEEVKTEQVKDENNNEEKNTESKETTSKKEDEVSNALDEIASKHEEDKTSNENTTVEESKEVTSTFMPLPELLFNDNDPEKYVEKKRNDFKKLVNKSSLFSKIANFVIFGFLIIAIILMITVKNEGIKWVAYIPLALAIVGFIFSFIYSRREQKNINLEVKSYVTDVISQLDAFYFSNIENLENVTFSTSAKADLADLTEAHYFDTIQDFNSRNVVKADYKGLEIKVSEVACRNPYQAPEGVQTGRKTPTASYGIFGKYISYPITLKENASVILLLLGTNSYIPTYLDGYMEVDVTKYFSDSYDEKAQGKYRCWTDNNVVLEQLLSNKDLVELLNSFSPDENLENLFISINSHGLKFCLNYNESVMEVPTEKPVSGSPYKHFRADFEKVLKFIDLIK